MSPVARVTPAGDRSPPTEGAGILASALTHITGQGTGDNPTASTVGALVLGGEAVTDGFPVATTELLILLPAAGAWARHERGIGAPRPPR